MLYSMKCFPLSIVTVWTAKYGVMAVSKSFLPGVKELKERNETEYSGILDSLVVC